MSLSPSEKKSVLDRIPYFSKKPIVFDIGSNKGEFADLLIDNVSEMHLFEPNEMLLTYTKVKYCDRRNIFYLNKALYSQSDLSIDFHEFKDEQNGLSSIYDNEEWKRLGGCEVVTVATVTIDDYCSFKKIDEIDFVKLDIEGAEWDAIQGAARMLEEKRIKYIQIEYGAHYMLNNYKFKDLIKFVNGFGYKVYSIDVEGLEFTVDNFVEDYRFENFIIKDMSFTENWNAEFKKNTQGMKFNFALEIGAFEGLTSCYICDNLLKPGGRMIAVDPLKDSYLTTDLTDEDRQMNKELSSMFEGQHARFKRNTRGKPIELIRKTSREAFEELKAYRFDFIYIDGDHRKREVFNDAIECLKLVKVGGHILFDDYEWREQTTIGINGFLNRYVANIQIVSKGYQVLIKKIANYDIRR